MKNILIQLAHPAHYYFYKEIIKNLIANKNNVTIVITTKDILERLLILDNIPYINIMKVSHKENKIGYLYDMIKRILLIIKITLTKNIHILTGSTVEISFVAWLFRKMSINIGEDDASVVEKYINTIAPFVDVRLSPITCNTGKIENSTIHYDGFQKLAYLHPNHFKPNVDIVKQYGIEYNKPYFLMRFSKLNAHHDDGISGIDTEIAQRLIDILSPIGRVFITSERELEPQFEKYRLQINPLDIHHVMAFATLYLGDSQSMAVEAAMLGIPSLRFNDFVGPKRIGVLVELEEKYKLTYGISSKEPEVLYDKVKEILALPNIREEWQNRRKKMLADKIDVTAFFTWFIENYPESKKIMKENPDYQYNFK